MALQLRQPALALPAPRIALIAGYVASQVTMRHPANKSTQLRGRPLGSQLADGDVDRDI
jgi:hypothetical protein